MTKFKIEKYVIYATRMGRDRPWTWWARPPWGTPVSFTSWTGARDHLARHARSENRR